MRRLLHFRYDVQIHGLDLIRPGETSLILPAHIALVDPMIMTAYISHKCNFYPVSSRKYYDKPLLRPFFRAMNAIPVEDLDADSSQHLDIHEITSQIYKNLTHHHSVLLYPQGGLSAQGFQSIIGKKSAFYAVEKAPADTKIFTVNIRGLRGSRSSKARSGRGVSLFPFLVRGAGILLANLFVFTPKHKVEIEITDATKILRSPKVISDINSFNIQLEKLYNARGEEEVHYVSALSYFDTVQHRLPPAKIEGSLSSLRITNDYSHLSYSAETMDFITQTLQTLTQNPSIQLNLDTNLVLDLLLDSLDMASLKQEILKKYPNSSNISLSDLKTVGDLIHMTLGGSSSQPTLKPCKRDFPVDNTLLYSHLQTSYTPSDTIISMMKKSFQRLHGASVCYDQLFGVQSSRSFLIKAYLIADILRRFPESHIGILLPSLSATSLLIVGCYLASKTPVMLNRTQSEAGFRHCLKIQKIKTILTAKSFFQKIQTPRLQTYEMTYFEELLQQTSIFQKISAVISSFRFSIPHLDPNSTAVVLFTSGSESLPKAVALTHRNLLSDIVGALGRIQIRTSDILLAFLPPFHSFGFTVNTILPLISGLRTVNYPDPNDAQTLSDLISHTHTTLITSTPTFFRRILDSAESSQVKTLRLAITGAEKAPASLLTLMRQKNKKTELLEGYGITECSPIIAVGEKPGSCGKVIIGGEILINDKGMILVHGDFVFDGYLDPKLDSPFEYIDGKKYYITGDLGYFDDDGNLQISGRLKRFVKIAGEMISLPAIEEALGLSVEAREYEDGTAKFVAFSTEKIDIKQLNKTLREKKFSNLVKISEVQILPEIPLLGSGKADFMTLRAMIK
ncbi:hypothetical protein AGMMS50249_4500 [candidate division SR1 bacterium]|nr:hypothetical protein AGMMS50249_4500 [candidate division SR1 bacterium]